MGVTIRTARLADRSRILAISSQIWEGDDYVPQIIDEWLRMRGSEVTVADLNGSVIAFARTVNLTPGYVWLEGIRTDTASQGHGAGKALTEYFIEKATREGAQRIGLSTYIDNLASIHIIEQHRFVRQASFILAEAKLDGPARSTAELSPLVSEVPFDEARAWILGSASIAMSCGFVGQGWTFWPASRPGVVAWPVFDKAIGLRGSKGSLRSLLVVCHPDRGAGEVSIDFADGSPKHLEVLVRHALALYPGAKCIQTMIPAGQAVHTNLLETVTALEFDVWRHGEPDVFVYERPVE
ncbi:GNAT family N-acetyltransferase [Candidatus Cryosericum septentrionale]|jgi:GNAT superfamily N-acetyltransferase|uniref:GNAT family N-acetyltransferase n=1 Tax=Candidatus Cryosericum septentrionale TaxID=2290913 RepID=A0A398DKF3_9BACT|nr:GNAT family N-acetyltransferase [Candidatus Cryosericum septentrionale]RIE15635.1 GNAT family N-acetyltransferase [Candidatus Cryosericum septentrionale]